MVNKKLLPIMLATLVTMGVVGGTSVAFAQVAVSRTVVAVAEGQPTLSNFVKYLNATNLTASLNDTTKNFTVFSPTNAAWAAVSNTTLNNTAQLAVILKDHVVPQKVNLTTNGTYQTLGGDTLQVTVNGTQRMVQLGNSSANFTGTLLNTSNGQIQPVDAVLMPPAAAGAAASASAAGGFLGLPGFEAIYAVAGLLVVAYLVMRRRR
jgi:PGF-CTERM protein